MNNFICPQEEIQIVLLMAWRYASNRHYTQCAIRDNYPLTQIIIDNFDNIEDWVLEQMYEDIIHEKLIAGKEADYLNPLKRKIQEELFKRAGATND